MSNPQSLPKHDAEEFSAGFVVFSQKADQRKYLLLHYPSGHWDFAKGHLEENENEIQAAIRELEEETSIKKIKVIEGFSEAVVYFFQRHNKLIKKTVTFFLGNTESLDVKVSHEHQGYLWLDYSSALAKITFENARHILRRAENFLQNNKNL